MRSEKEIYELVRSVADNSKHIRAVYMNGSRANAHAPHDIFQDYDIVFVVDNVLPFIEDELWIDIFGERLMTQEPDKLDKYLTKNTDFENVYTYLMLFTDGNRIDLKLQSLEYTAENFHKEKYFLILLDKDGILPPPDSFEYPAHGIRKPAEGEYVACCNEFWWTTQNVAKGIWRDQLAYAKNMFGSVMRPEIEKMVAWWIGVRYGFETNAGKMGKYFKNYLPTEYWNLYKKTYSGADYDDFWGSLFSACELFRVMGREVADSMDFSYPESDDRNMTAYIRSVKELPKDANEIKISL